MDRRRRLQLIGGIISLIAVIAGASSVFQSASTPHVISLIAGSFAAGATVTSILGTKKKNG